MILHCEVVKMSKQNLYKVTFQNENGVFVSLMASVNTDLSKDDALLLLTKEVASNYCEDNHFIYDNKIINDLKDSANMRLLGTFEPLDKSSESMDFDILSFNKTKHWYL